jgi:uncharacterized protein
MNVAAIALAGAGIGLFFGIFGAGGSAFATPVLALLGVPGAFAIASPLPAMLPAAFSGARRHLRSGHLDRRVAALSVTGGLPATFVGAQASQAFTPQQLLLASGLLLFVIGLRMAWPTQAAMPSDSNALESLQAPRANTALVVTAAAAVGFLSGLLANGGGFLLVPMFVLLLGLDQRRAAGTSMVTVGVLTIPTLLAHWSIGNIDWAVAAAFSVGMLPGSSLGSRLSSRIPPNASKSAFGVVLAVFAAWFLITRAH